MFSRLNAASEDEWSIGLSLTDKRLRQDHPEQYFVLCGAQARDSQD